MENNLPKGNEKYPKGLTGNLVVFLATCTSIYHLFFILGVFQRVGLFIHAAQHFAISLGLILVLIFLLRSIKGQQRVGKVPWYDVLLAAGGLVSCSYQVLFPELVLNHIIRMQVTFIEMVLAVILFATLMEAVRRTIGIAMCIFTAILVLYVFISNHLPGLLFARSIDFSQAVTGIYLSNNGIFSIAVRVASTIIFPFVIFSSMLLVSGAGKFLVDLALALTGSFRGGPAKVAVVSSAFFGTLSGSTVANVVSTGSITIPLMKQIGYRANFAGAVEAVASNGGQIMPPVMGVVAFIMAEVTGIPYIKIALSAIFPAILYYTSLFVAVDLEAARIGLIGLPPEHKPSLNKVLKEGWHYLLPIVALIFILALLPVPAELGAVYGTGGILLAAAFRKESRIGIRRLIRGLEGGARTMIMIGPACGLAGVLLCTMSVSGIGIILTGSLVDIAGGSKLLLLLIAAALCFLMGTGLEAIIIYMTLAALVAPVLVRMGVDMLAAHFFIFYFGIVSLITPPVAMAAFVAAGIAGGKAWETGWQATRLGLATYMIPFSFVYNSALLLKGSPLEIVLAVVTGAIGSALLATGTIGFLIKPLSLLQRIIIIISSFLLIFASWLTDAIGFILAAAILLPQLSSVVKARFKKSTES